MRKTIHMGLIIFALATASCCHRGAVPEGSPAVLTVEQIAQQPKKYSGRAVQTEGVLKNAGGNYFTDLRLILTGNKGGEIEVTAWAPLEVPPPRPGPNRPRRPKVMSDFLGKKMNLTGRLEDHSGKIILRVEKAEEINGREGDAAE